MATQARIEINGTPGSNNDLPINTLVQLSNQDLGGETTYLWVILDQPLGTADTLSALNIENPTFTPKKEGTYLLQLIVNFGLPDEQIDRAVVAIRQLKTRERIPAAGETNEDDTMRGWATAVGSLYQRIDALLSDPGIIVGANTSGSTLTRGDVVRVTSGQVIKGGLPGQETVPGFVKAPATVLGDIDELLCVVEGDVLGNPSAAIGALTKVRYIGRLANIAIGTGAVGDPIYVSDTATIATTPGTYRRQVGSIMSVSGGLRDFWFDGVGGADITPIDRGYMLYGAPSSGMLNAKRIDGTNATGGLAGVPYTFRAGDNATVALVAKRFGVGGQDIFQVQDDLGNVFARFNVIGDLDMGFQRIQRAEFQAQNGTTVPLFPRRFNAGATANLYENQDELGAALSAFLSTGDLDMLGKKIQGAIFQAVNGTTTPLFAKRFNAGAIADLFQVLTETSAALASFSANGTLFMYASPIDMVSHRINNLLDPAAAQDATTKLYVDSLAENTRLLSNKVDNSTFFLKQHVGIEPLIIPTVRGFPRVDRWGLWRTNAADTGAGVSTSVSTDPNLGEVYVVCPTAAPDTIWITQELSREDGVPQACAGRPLVLTFQAKRNTVGSPASITARVVSTTSAAPGTATPDYPATNQVDASTVFSFPPVPGNYATYTLVVPALRAGVTAVSVQFSFTFSATSAAAFGYVRRVMLVEGAIAPAWQMRHGNIGAEFENAERFFQTTWSNGGSTWPQNLGISNISVANGADWPVAQVRFRTRMRSPTPNVTVQTPAFVLGSIDVTGTARVTSIARSNDMGFDVANNTGVTVSPTTPWTVRFFWEASAEY